MCVSTPASKELNLYIKEGAVAHYHSLATEDSDSSVVI